MIALKEKVLICIFAYAVAFLFSFNYYQSDIEMYQGALAGKIYLFNPSQEELARHEERKLEQKAEQERAKKEYEKSPNGLNHFLYYNQIPLNEPKSSNPPREKILSLLDDAKDKRKTMMINSFGIATVCLAALFLITNKAKAGGKSK